jgi:hypothetical protein
MARTGLLLAAVAAVVGTLSVAGFAGTGDGGTPVSASFRLGDGSVGCAYADGTIRCRSKGGPAALTLEPGGDSHASDDHVLWDRSTPVLLGGESWWNGDVTCLAGESDITCSTANGGRIIVAADGAGALAPPVSVSRD